MKGLPLLLAVFLFIGVSFSARAMEGVRVPPLQNPPVAVQITGLQYDSDSNKYVVNFSVANVQRVQRLVLTVEEEAGTIAYSEEVKPKTSSTFTSNLDGNRFTADQKYLLIIEAVDVQGNYLTKDETNGVTDDTPTRLATKPFVHKPILPSAANFTIKAVNVNFNANVLDIALEVPPTNTMLTYEGRIVGEDGGSVMELDTELLKEDHIRVDLTPKMWEMPSNGGSNAYELILKLTTTDNLVSTQTYEFKATPPPPPGLVTRIIGTVTTSPYVLAAIAFVASAVFVYFMRRRSSVTPVFSAQRPPIDSTIQIPNEPPIRAAPPRQSRLRIRVIQSPEIPRNTERVIERFPYKLGRRDFPKDSQVSREHAELSVKSGQFFITDLDSTNQTSVHDVPILSRTAVPIEGVTVIRLGPNTSIEVDPRG